MNKFILMFFAVIAFTATAQEEKKTSVFNDGIDISSVTTDNNVANLTPVTDNCLELDGYTFVDHSQKTLSWSNGLSGDDANYYSITLTRHINRSTNHEISRFVYTVEGETMSTADNDYIINSGAIFHYLTLPDSITLYDFKIFEDTLYFCGRMITKQNSAELLPWICPEENDTTGVLGWMSLKGLMYNFNTPTVNYIRTGYEFTRLRVFKDIEDGKRTKVAVMGIHKTPPTYDDNASMVSAEYCSCLFLYNPMGQNKMLTCTKKTNEERFQDIKLIGNEIGIASLEYSTSFPQYTDNGDQISDKVIYRTVNATTLEQTDSYFNIRWMDINTNSYFGDYIGKGVYNVRLDYAGPAVGLTNLHNGNNLGNTNGFTYDDDMPAYYYDHYETMKYTYEYNLLLSFNHYEYNIIVNPDGSKYRYYSTVLNWVSHKELKHYNNHHLGCKSSARIYEGERELKLININKLPENTFAVQTEIPTNKITDVGSSSYTVIMDKGEGYDTIYGVTLDDHTNDHESFFTTTADSMDSYSPAVYIRGGDRYLTRITLPVPTVNRGIHFNDSPLLKSTNNVFRAVGTAYQKLFYLQYTDNETPCYSSDRRAFSLQAYPVGKNYEEENYLNIEDDVNQVQTTETQMFRCFSTGDCESDYLYENGR